MRYLLFLITLLSLAPVPSSLALNLHEVVALTLANNQRIVQFQATEQESAAAASSARSAFYPRLDLNYSYTRHNEPQPGEEKEFSILSLSASYNLFKGLTDYNTTKAAEARSKAAGYQLRAVTADLILDVKQAYISQRRAARSVDTSREGVELLQRQQHDVELYFKQGMIARNDLLRVEVELSSARQDLLQAQGNLQIANHRLERLMGVPLDQGQSLEDFFQLPQLTKDDTEFYRLKLLQRSELLYLGQLLEAADRDRSAAKGNNLPRVDLTLAHDEYGDSISPTNGDFDEDDKLMLTASWNLFNGFATHQSVAVADSRKRGISAELQDTRDALFLQLQTALSDIRVAQGKLQEALSGITQAEENYRVTKSRYRQQQATTFDLLDARFLLTRARNQEINARYDLHSKAAVLDRVLERDLRH